ncbi:MAG: hypothetical protein PWQ64_220 [Desulfomicrobiaceae bacterium]|nr:hypothetical protein [Desulfomicrobiaceae bacterium]
MLRKKLPIGIQTFSEIRREGYYYVDKTPFVAALAASGKYYFLSRPRRFGKSLFLDTLAEAFAANRALFTGLYLEDHWDWEKRHPVIRVNFASGVLHDPKHLEEHIHTTLERNAEALNVSIPGRSTSPAIRFDELILAAHRHCGEKVVVLVDEYDKPILDNITEPDIARQMRDGLRNLYSVLKGRDADLRFVFLTGVSKFSKVSIFSGLNNLRDITLASEFATICGYTDEDVDCVFAPELGDLDRDAIRHWYNGYRWGDTPVYNPFDVLLLFQERQFRSWWFETGTPTFLVEWLKKQQFFTPSLEHTFADDELLSVFDVDHIGLEAMLWQTGYLTIAQRESDGVLTAYTLRVPNLEVRMALNRSLLAAWIPNDAEVMRHALPLRRAFAAADTQAVRQHFERLFAGIPHSWYDTSPIAQYEGYFASVFYSHLASLGLSIIAEDVSSFGRCDLTVRHHDTVWIFEFKVIHQDTPTGTALTQIQTKNYAAKYRAPGVRVLEVGVEFSAAQRQIVGWKVGAD